MLIYSHFVYNTEKEKILIFLEELIQYVEYTKGT